VVAVVGAVAVLAAVRAARVENDDDLLAFLPEGNEDVRTFYEINERFGGTDVALVGIETDDPLSADFLTRLQRATRELREAGGLSHVLSLTNVVDSVADEVNGGVITTNLVEEIPTTPEAREALRRRVFSREAVVGNLIAADGRAVLVYCFLAGGTEPRQMSAKIRDIVTAAFPGNTIRWGGNPFVSSYVYDAVQRDLQRLSPWAVLVIVLLMVVALRHGLGTLVALFTSAVGVSITVGLMQTLGIRLNLALGSMPIVLFTIGCTYAIHVVSRFFEYREQEELAPALARTVRGIGPVVLAAGVTAAAAIGSFGVMDIKPIRLFGLFTAVGILVSMVVSLTFLPAAIRVLNLEKRRGRPRDVFKRAVVRLSVFAQTHRAPVGLGLVAVALAFSALIVRVRTGVDQSSFFRAGSPPDQADAFLRDHFGAAQFLQVQVEGDLTDPTVLLEVQNLADRFLQVPHVTQVQHIGQVIAGVNEAMTGHPRLPDTPGQVESLFGFLIGDRSVAQLITQDRRQALLQVKVDTSRAADLDIVLDGIHQAIAAQDLGHHRVTRVAEHPEGRARKRAALALRLQILAERHDLALPGDLDARLGAFLDTDPGTADAATVATRLERFLRSGECAAELPPPGAGRDPAAAVARALAALGPEPGEEAIRTATASALALSPDASLVEDVTFSVSGPIADAWRSERATQKAGRLLAALDLPPDNASSLGPAVTSALLDLEHPEVLLPAAAGAPGGELRVSVNGLPVLHRGLAKSVKRNQLQSIFLAVALVVLILSAMLGSLKSGIMAAMPTMLTLVLIHGAMGLFGFNLDVGTSLLGSLILANGIDYAVHLIAAWETPPAGTLARAAAVAADRAGPAIWIAAATMFVGFFVLSLGEAKVLSVVTGLKAAAMLVGALTTFLVVPLLARKPSYLVFNERFEAIEPSPVVDAVLAAGPPRAH
jgi:hypothetical protein